MTCYIGIIVYLINILSCKVMKRTKRVKAMEMDLHSGRREFEELEEQERLVATHTLSLIDKAKNLVRRRQNGHVQ
jgi:amino acid permease